MNAAADIELNVTEIQRFCMHDGPGVRTTVFLKGCPLRCAWCHNPETQRTEKELLFYNKKCIFCGACAEACQRNVHTLGETHEIRRENCDACGACVGVCPTAALQICGRRMTVSGILEEIKKDAAFYGDAGGVTVSGGEPFMQPEGLFALLSACRSEGIGTAVDTCGFFGKDLLERAVPLTDLFLWDIKDTDDGRHVKYTGAGTGRIAENLEYADSLGARIRLRCILVNGVNTNDLHYENLRRTAESLHNPDGIDIIPYHAYSGTKSVFLGLPDSGRPEWIPDADTLRYAEKKIKGLP